MAKVWEEEWTSDGDGGLIINDDEIAQFIVPTNVSIIAPRHEARATLAAQAPAMARTLLALHDWMKMSGRNGSAAPEIERVLRAAGVIE
jgi:hypothetical protein